MQASYKERKGMSWCGPTAITCVAGVSYERAEEAAREYHYRPDGVIIGLSNDALVWALEDLDFRCRKLGRRARGHTLGNYLGDPAWRRAAGYGGLILNVTNHYVAFDPATGRVFDQNTGEAGKPWREFWAKRKRVKVAWTFTRA